MKVIILAGGKGTRLKPLTDNTPKCLIEVGGNPILGHILEWVNQMDVSEVRMLIGTHGDQVKDYIRGNRSGWDTLSFRYSEEQEQRGTAYAALCALSDLRLSRESCLILNADVIPIGKGANQLAGQLSVPDEKKPPFSIISVFESDTPEKYGVVELYGSPAARRYGIRSIEEKPDAPKSNLISTGFNYVRRIDYLYDALDKIIKYKLKIKGEYYITSALNLMCQHGEGFHALHVQGLDCGDHEGLDNARQHFHQ